MRRMSQILVLLACGLIASLSVAAQEKKEATPKQVYTGTIVSMSGGLASTSFSLTLAGLTTNEETEKYLSVLAEDDQDALLKELRNKKLGSFAATGQTGRDLLVVRDVKVDGKRRVTAVFERWLRFREVRNGYRSEDYPFAIVEIFFDEKGKGTGTFIGAAKVRIVKNKKTGESQLEIENFATYPAKIMGVIRRNKRR